MYHTGCRTATSLDASNEGYTTPEKAAATAAALRRALAARLKSASERLVAAALELESGDLARRGDAVREEDDLKGHVPDFSAWRRVMSTYDIAAWGKSAHIERIPLEIVREAKSYLGEHSEHTVILGMAVEWAMSIDDCGEQRHEGRVIGMDLSEVAVASVTVWRGGVGSSVPGIHVIKNASLRAREPDLY